MAAIVDYLSLNPGKVAVSNAKCTWGLPDTLRVLRGAEQILLPLNLDNNHWVALRIHPAVSLTRKHLCTCLSFWTCAWKGAAPAYSLVELFLWFGTQHERERALVHAQSIANYLVAAGVFKGAPTFRVHTSLCWRQRDGSSCGLFTLVGILSLVEGRRMHVSMSESGAVAWRKYFAALVTDAVCW